MEDKARHVHMYFNFIEQLLCGSTTTVTHQRLTFLLINRKLTVFSWLIAVKLTSTSGPSGRPAGGLAEHCMCHQNTSASVVASLIS